MSYSDIMGCELGCEVVGAGWPLAFIVDYPGLSPAGTASLGGALTGVDQVRTYELVVCFINWLNFTLLIVWIASLVKRRMRE